MGKGDGARSSVDCIPEEDLPWAMAEGRSDGREFDRLIAPMGAKEFFDRIWQKSPYIASHADDRTAGELSTDETDRRPLGARSWADACDMLLLSTGFGSPVPVPEGTDLLVFKDRGLTGEYCETGPYAALLDGASCVVNHAEHVFPPLTRLCLALRRQLLHVYANSYVTPPKSQAVSLHADDRDVFILQLAGSKMWRVWDPHLKLPYTDEQVGKNGFECPSGWTDRPPTLEHLMLPGDVLYMPRGWLHEAHTSENTSSWHATLAVATHDWSWSKVFGAVATEALDAERTARWREAVPLGMGMPGVDEAGGPLFDVAQSEAELAALLGAVREAVTVEAMRRRFTTKMESHNRNQIASAFAFQGPFSVNASCSNTFQRLSSVRLTTRVRKSTREEKESLRREGYFEAVRLSRKGKGKGKDYHDGSRGLLVRDEIAKAVMNTLGEIEDRRSEGISMTEIPEVCDLFDELARLCFVRLCVCNGHLRIVDAETGL